MNQLKTADHLGWGILTAKLDHTKASVIKQYTIGKVLLDVGCATGVYTTHARKYTSLVIGIDKQISLLKHAHKKNSTPHHINADALFLPVKNNSVDTTILFDVLEHIDECPFIEEVKRVTKKRIIITVPRTTNPELLNNFLVFGHHQDTTHLRTYTMKSLQKLAQKYHLKIIKIKPIHPISTDSLIMDILKGPTVLKRLFRKIAFILLKPKTFYSNLLLVADINHF